MDSRRKLIQVTHLGEYIRHRSCDRRFHLTANDEVVRALPFLDPLLNTIEPILGRVGDAREDVWEDELKRAGYADLAAGLTRGKHKSVEWAALAGSLAALPPGTYGYARQVKVEADLGAFAVSGLIDFVLVRWDGGRPRVWLVECKASRRDRTYHRVQVATYRLLLRRLLGGRAMYVGGTVVPADAIACAVARIDAATNANQSVLTLDPLDLSAIEADVELLLAPGGRLDRAVSGNLHDLAFRLDEKCDGCVVNVYCMAETARLRRPELLGLDPTFARQLAAAGLRTLDDVAHPPVFGTPAMRAVQDLDPGFTAKLKRLSVHAKARRHTLPAIGASPAADEYDATPIPFVGSGGLPAYDGEHGRLLRVYLTVDYDYTENRVGALSAHVTRAAASERLHTPFGNVDGRWQSLPGIGEQVAVGFNEKGLPTFEKDSPPRKLAGRDVVEFQQQQWSGTDHAADSVAEGELIRRFFRRLTDAMTEVASADTAPVHFYVWSAGEVKQLMEGCGRAGPDLLGHLTHLFGCREGLEQLLYSCVRDEIDRRFALGWTGRGLAVVASLRWFGRRYHWRRTVNGTVHDLDHVFAQNVFDFKTQLDVDAAGGWAKVGEGTKHPFEIRARFSDSLPAAYWHAVWGTLPHPAEVSDPRIAAALERYRKAADPALLEAYLAARCHALRWLEENVTPKNADVGKPPVSLAALPAFNLNRHGVAEAALDFLRLDHHVKKSDWVAERLLPPGVRVPLGRTLPLQKVRAEKDRKTLRGRIMLSGFDPLTLPTLKTLCSGFTPGAFVRLCPWNGDPQRGQTVKQLTSGLARTCVLKAIDWATGEVTLENLPAEEDGYTLPSGTSKSAEPLFTDGYATLDESVTDFVARRVDARLQLPSAVYAWFDPTAPAPPPVPPPPSGQAEQMRALLDSFPLPPTGHPPQADQVQAVLDGLATRVHLLLGPPGTGKTTTTALAVLARVLCHARPGDVVLLAAHTHRAVTELLERIDRYAAVFRTHAAAAGFATLPVRLVKLYSREPSGESAGGIEQVDVAELKTKKKLEELTTGGVLAVGGTTAGLLALAEGVRKLKTYNGGAGLTASLLVVDEASMMVFPHFLALATLAAADGRVMLTGDHHQLAPITAHEWDAEDRPPAVLYQPFASAYDAVRRIVRPDAPLAARQSALRWTFRLPPAIRDLIARIYHRDGVELTGPRGDAKDVPVSGDGVWHRVWARSAGLYLVVHDEATSHQRNPTELAIVTHLLDAAPPSIPAGSVAVVTPHRAQRALFQELKAMPGGAVDVIDTVERLQGGERQTVVVSASASDPAAIEANAEFVLDRNRSNVAFSRAKERLVVVCGQALLDHVPAEVELYEQAVLWKTLRQVCTEEVGRTEVNGHLVRVLTPPTALIATPPFTSSA